MRVVLQLVLLAWPLSLGLACSSAPTSREGLKVEQTPPWPSMSGVAELEDGRFLVVHDAKPGSSDPVLGVVTPGTDGGYRALALPAFDPPLSDVEALVSLPDVKDQFLLLESGAADAPRRVVRVSLTHDTAGGITPTVLGTVDIRPGTPRVRNAESLAVESFDVATSVATLLVADRTSLGPSRPSATVSVYRVAVRFDTGVALAVSLAFRYAIEASFFEGKARGAIRCASDLVWVSDGVVIGAATVDGGGEGPFASVVYRVEWKPRDGRRGRVPRPEVLAVIDGFKVEGLALAHSPDTLWIATDDEAFGGVVRAIAISATEAMPEGP